MPPGILKRQNSSALSLTLSEGSIKERRNSAATMLARRYRGNKAREKVKGMIKAVQAPRMITAQVVKKLEPLERTLVIRTVEVNRLSDIDIIGQRFKAEVVLQLAFEGGALDPHLKEASADFPLDSTGRPTFRPSAGWYMAQVDFNNAHEYKLLDQKLMRVDDDLVMNLRFEGTFSELMELENFPFDVQDLTMSMAFNCRTTGMMPLKIVLSKDLTTGILPSAFVDKAMWSLHQEINVCPCEHGLGADRMFPSIDLSLLVVRQPNFYLWNVALPVFFFVPMAMLSFAVNRNEPDARLSVSLAIVLTAVAHKFSMTTLVPAISYMTLLDIYVTASLLQILFITFQGGIIGTIEVYYCRLQASYTDPRALLDDSAGDAIGGADDDPHRSLYEEYDDEYDDDEMGLVRDDSFSGQATRAVGRMLRQALGRRLVVPRGRGGGGATGHILYYRDQQCPPEKMGPLNIFDAVDVIFFLIDAFLWLYLQYWSYHAYMDLIDEFNDRKAVITENLAKGRNLSPETTRRAEQEEKEPTQSASGAPIGRMFRKASTVVNLTSTLVNMTKSENEPPLKSSLPRREAFASAKATRMV